MVVMILWGVAGCALIQGNKCTVPETVPVRFAYENREAAAVSVTGDFNGWSPTADRMKRHGSRWSVTLCLAPGRYRYQFVIDQGPWIPDPQALLSERSGFGSNKSGLVVEEVVTPEPGGA